MPQRSLPQIKNDSTHSRLRFFFALLALESISILLWILSTPSDADARAFLGYSLQRWGLIGMTVGLAGVFLTGFILLRRDQTWRRLYEFAEKTGLVCYLTLGCLFFLILLQSASHFLTTTDLPVLRAAYSRLLPFIVYLFLFYGQTLILSIALIREQSFPYKSIVKLGFWIWALLITAGVAILITRFSLVPTSNGWYEYGVPLVSQQILDLFYLAVITLSAGLLFTRRKGIQAQGTDAVSRSKGLTLSPLLVDLSVTVLLWAAAALLWLSFPVPTTWMSPKVYPPNFEIYPNSDAMLYDASARGILSGVEWAHQDIPYKPLYVAFLTVLHAVGGSTYPNLVVLQTLVLALFPAMLYGLGRVLHSRLAGILVALLAILREYNQLIAAPLTTLSFSKLLLSELPTALGISALLVVLAFWLQSPRRRIGLAAAAGGVIALLIQIRLQTILFLPALIVFLLFFFSKHEPKKKRPYLSIQWKTWLFASGLILIGFAACIFPLAARNWRASGTFALEKPGYFQRTLNYSYTPADPADPGELSVEPGRSTQPAAQGNLIQRVQGQFVLVSSHFVHNTVSTFLTLPSGLGLPGGWSMTKDLETRFWLTELPPLTLPSAVLILLNLGLIALGVSVLWRSQRWLGLLPAVLFAAYNLSSALGGFSGQRFVLPVDWVGYFYFAVGLTWLAAALLSPLGWNAFERLPSWLSPAQPKPEQSGGDERLLIRSLRRAAPVYISLILLAALLPLEEALIPVQIPRLNQPAAQAQLARIAETAFTPEQQRIFQSLLTRSDTVVMQGAALYPRAIQDSKEAGGVLRYAGDSPYPVLSYLLIGSERHWVLQAIEQPKEASLPDGTQVIVVGRLVPGWNEDQTVRAFLTLRMDTQSIQLSSDFQEPSR